MSELGRQSYREGDAPAEPPMRIQPPKNLPLGNSSCTPDFCPSGHTSREAITGGSAGASPSRVWHFRVVGPLLRSQVQSLDVRNRLRPQGFENRPAGGETVRDPRFVAILVQC